MFPFGVTIPATVPQRSEIPEGLMNYPVLYVLKYTNSVVPDYGNLINLNSVKTLSTVEFVGC